MTLVIEYETPFGITCSSAVCVIKDVVCRKDDNYRVIYTGKVYADATAYSGEKGAIGAFHGDFALDITNETDQTNLVRQCYADLKLTYPDGIDG